VPLAESRTIEFLGHQSPVPFEDCLRFDDDDRVRHQFAEGDGLRREGASLVVGQENTAVNLVA
jgi:hypothetical protein